MQHQVRQDVVFMFIQLIQMSTFFYSTFLMSYKLIAGKGQNTREISITNQADALGEAKTGAFLGLHAMSGTEWGDKFATISKKAWGKSFLELDDNYEILGALSSLGATLQFRQHVQHWKNSYVWFMHQSL